MVSLDGKYLECLVSLECEYLESLVSLECKYLECLDMISVMPVKLETRTRFYLS